MTTRATLALLLSLSGVIPITSTDGCGTSGGGTLAFGPESTYVHVDATNTQLGIGGSDGGASFSVTVRARFEAEQVAEYPTLFSLRGTEEYQGCFLALNNGYKQAGGIFLQLDGKNLSMFEQPVDLRDGAWHDLAAVRDSSVSEVRYYVDGVLIETVAWTSARNSIQGTGTLMIGFDAASPYGTAMYGSIHDLAFYDRALTQDEVSSIVEGQSGHSGAIAAWPLDEGNGQLAADAFGNWDGVLGDSTAAEATDPVWME